MTKRILSPLYKALLALLLFSVSCIDPYLEDFSVDKTIFIVDARVTNDASSNYVKLTEAIPNSGLSTSYLPVEGATMSVMEDGASEINLTEGKAGVYKFPTGFAGKLGSSYQLKFTTPNGKSFESKSEKMEPSTVIERVYHTYDERAIKNPLSTDPGQLVYIDTKDPANTKDFYMWDWVLYEQQFYCKTCEGGYYYNDASTGPLGECRTINFRRNTKFDYTCKSRCWDIIATNKINVMNDDFSNGQEIKGRLVASIPVYQKIGALLEIRQYGISKSVYDYLRLIESQGQNTGGLADTPPATLAGNVNSVSDPNQAIAGYFIVSSVSKKLYWLDKNDIPNGTHQIGLFGGRAVNPEPPSNDTTRPPMAPCIDSDERTSKEPEGWIKFEDTI